MTDGSERMPLPLEIITWQAKQVCTLPMASQGGGFVQDVRIIPVQEPMKVRENASGRTKPPRAATGRPNGIAPAKPGRFCALVRRSAQVSCKRPPIRADFMQRVINSNRFRVSKAAPAADAKPRSPRKPKTHPKRRFGASGRSGVHQIDGWGAFPVLHGCICPGHKFRASRKHASNGYSVHSRDPECTKSTVGACFPDAADPTPAREPAR